MSTRQNISQRLSLVPLTRDDAREELEQMQPHEREELSAAWLALLDATSAADPWVHGFVAMHTECGCGIGRCGFKGPPGDDGIVEVAYFVAPEHRGNGYAAEMAEALVHYAFADERVRVVRAHTLLESNASARALTKCGFQPLGQVIDPDDGLVWRWERLRG